MVNFQKPISSCCLSGPDIVFCFVAFQFGSIREAHRWRDLVCTWSISSQIFCVWFRQHFELCYSRRWWKSEVYANFYIQRLGFVRMITIFCPSRLCYPTTHDTNVCRKFFHPDCVAIFNKFVPLSKTSQLVLIWLAINCDHRFQTSRRIYH